MTFWARFTVIPAGGLCKPLLVRWRKFKACWERRGLQDGGSRTACIQVVNAGPCRLLLRSCMLSGAADCNCNLRTRFQLGLAHLQRCSQLHCCKHQDAVLVLQCLPQSQQAIIVCLTCCSRSVQKRSGLLASTVPDMVPVCVSRSRRQRSASIPSTCALSAAR